MFRSLKRSLVFLTLSGLCLGSSLAHAAQIALFMNGTYVDIDDEGEACEAEANNLQSEIDALGIHTLVPFTGITDADFTAALDGAQVLVIPELEIADLTPDLDTAARAVIVDFVEQGGSLLVFGSSSGPVQNLLNTLFGFSLEIISGGGQATKTAEAAGTIFADGPTDIPENDGTTSITASTFPVEAINVYNFDDGSDDNSLLAILPVGSGQIIYFGWDWFGAIPPGGSGADCDGAGQDGGWQSLLATALGEATPTPTPTPTALPDTDGDGVDDNDDNCPTDANADQDDIDGDGIGDECDPTPDGFELGGGGCSLQTSSQAPKAFGLAAGLLLAGAAWSRRKHSV